jgi:hypothetical protein
MDGSSHWVGQRWVSGPAPQSQCQFTPTFPPLVERSFCVQVKASSAARIHLRRHRSSKYFSTPRRRTGHLWNLMGLYSIISAIFEERTRCRRNPGILLLCLGSEKSFCSTLCPGVQGLSPKLHCPGRREIEDRKACSHEILAMPEPGPEGPDAQARPGHTGLGDVLEFEVGRLVIVVAIPRFPLPASPRARVQDLGHPAATSSHEWADGSSTSWRVHLAMPKRQESPA